MNTLLQDPGLAVALDKYAELSQDRQIQECIWAREKTERDRISEMAYLLQEAREEARKEAREKARKEAYQKNWNEGLKEGLEIGIKKSIIYTFSHFYPQADASEIQQILQTVNKEDDLNRLQDLFFDCQTASEYIDRAKEIQ